MTPRRASDYTPRPVIAGRLRILALALVALAALSLSACGNKNAQVTSADTEGVTVDVGSLGYQVQLSRQLNPRDTEDRSYLVGLPKGEPPLAPGETWFGVFLRVENNAKTDIPATGDFQIVDTQDKTFDPIPLDASANPFAYHATLVPASGVLPLPDSAAATNPIGGSLVLFRVKLSSLADRPLDLIIRSPLGPEHEARINLDV